MQNNILKITVVATLFMVCFTLSIWGYLVANLGWPEAIYRSIQLLVLEANFDGVTEPLSWQLEIARFLLPLFTVLAIVSLLLSYFRRQLLLLRIQFFYPNAIFFGIGRTARAIALSLPEKRRLLAIDMASHSDIALSLMGIHKLLLLEGDATDSRLLRRLPLFQTKDIYVFTGDDHRDLVIAMTLCDYLMAHAKSGQKLPKLIVDIDDEIFLQTAQSEPSFVRYRQRGGEILWFSARRQAARALLHKYPVLNKSSKINQIVHVAIVGFDELQQDVVRQILRTCVYLYSKKLHITVFSEDFENYQKFIKRHESLFGLDQSDPQSASIVPLASISHFENSPEASQHQQIQQAIDCVGCPFDVVYVHSESDYQCLFHSQRFQQGLFSLNKHSRVVCMLSGSHFSSSLSAENFISGTNGSYTEIWLFHCREALLQKGEGYPGEYMDSLGVKIHNAYTTIENTPELQQNIWDNFAQHFSESLSETKHIWQTKLSPQLMWSSRFAGDHLPVKLRELGFDVNQLQVEANFNENGPLDEIRVVIENNLELLMELEHRRFIAERLVDGWIYGPVSQRALKINSTLIPYNQLPEREKSKDQAMIRVLPWLIQ